MLEITNITLLLLQCSCFTITLVLALVLLFARVQLRTESRSYESSRWMLFAGLTLYAVHYLLQMIFGFRARSEEVGALVNILFYSPIALLLVLCTLRISVGQAFLRRITAVGVVFNILIYALFAIGYCSYRGLYMPWALSAMKVVYVAMIIFFNVYPGGELRRMHRKIEDETADDNTKYTLYMRSGTVLFYVMGAIGALSIFRTSTVAIAAFFFFLALMFYVVSFVTLGFNIQTLTSLVDEAEEVVEERNSREEGKGEKEEETGQQEKGRGGRGEVDESIAPAAPSSASRLSAAQVEQIEKAIARWRAERGYSTPNLTSITMAQRLGIPKRLLTQYLAEREGSTFRVWLSNIRIEESKRMLLTQTGYSIEAIAEACGFSSRSWMQEKFKASTGMTPAEWREAQKK